MHDIKSSLFYLLSVGPDYKLLERNLVHAHFLGVDQILLSVHVQDHEPIIEIANRYNAKIADIHEGLGIDSAARLSRMTKKYCQPNDWVIPADLDEFIQFPEPVFNLIALCNERGYDYVQGNFLDRVTVDGHLAELSSMSLWDQFPIGVQLTREICFANTGKISLARASIELANGHHYAKNGTACPKDECSTVVHHFKWDASVSKRNRAMMGLIAKTDSLYTHERELLHHYLEENDGCINALDPKLEPFWPCYKRTELDPSQHVTSRPDASNREQVSSSLALQQDLVFGYPTQVSGFSTTPADDDFFIIENTATQRRTKVNDIGRYLFEIADGRKSVKTICQEMMSAFPQSWWNIERDVQTAYRDLVNAGVLQMVFKTARLNNIDTLAVSENTRPRTDKPRILYIIWSYPQVSETYIYNEINALKADHQVYVVSLFPSDIALQDFVPHCYTQDPAEIESIIHSFQPTALHTHWLDNVPFVHGLALRTNTPFTVRAHSFDTERINKHNNIAYDQAWAANLAPLLNHELCLGVLSFPYTLSFFAEIGVAEQKIQACYPVVNFELFHDRSPNGKGVINVGACNPKKGMDTFIDLAREFTQTGFNLFPLGQHVQTITAYNDQQGSPVKIHAPVQPTDMPGYYKQNAWLLLTGKKDARLSGWPVSIAEAQASGLGVCIPDYRPEMHDYLGGAGMVYKSLDELRDILSQPYPGHMRNLGFEQAKKSDVRSHIHLLTQLWR